CSVLGLILTFPSTVSADDRNTCASAAENAQSLISDGSLLDAERDLLVCARPVCPQVVMTDCLAWLDDVRGKIPTLVVRAHEGARDLSAVRVYVDGKLVRQSLDGLAFPVDPGLRVLRV